MTQKKLKLVLKKDPDQVIRYWVALNDLMAGVVQMLSSAEGIASQTLMDKLYREQDYYFDLEEKFLDKFQKVTGQHPRDFDQFTNTLEDWVKWNLK